MTSAAIEPETEERVSPGAVWAVRGVELALVAAAALLAARLIWTLAAPDAFAPAVSVSSQAAAPQVRAGQDWSILWRSNPYSRGLERPAEIEDAPETSLNLTLNGVRADGTGAGVAYLKLPDNRTITARAGDDILEGVTLANVYADRVLLRRNGRLESLFNNDDGALFGRAIDRGAPTGGVYRFTGSLDSLMAALTLSPVFEGEAVAGVRIDAAPDDVLESAGLSRGDVVRSVNGQAVSADMDIQQFQSLASDGSSVIIALDRDGRALTRRIQLEGVQP